MMSLKNIAFTFLFRSPDQETCPDCFTHPENFLGISFGLMRFFWCILNGRNICTLQAIQMLFDSP
jgi:hypothetical protein